MARRAAEAAILAWGAFTWTSRPAAAPFHGSRRRRPASGQAMRKHRRCTRFDAGWWWGWRLRCCRVPAMPRAQWTEGDTPRPMARDEAEVAVRNQTEPGAPGGVRAMLAATLAKVTGDCQVGPARRATSWPRPRTMSPASTTGAGRGRVRDRAPSFQTTLVVRFKQEAVDDLIDMLGIPVRPSPRPKPVLWLAIDGSGPRLAGLAEQRSARHPRPGQGTGSRRPAGRQCRRAGRSDRARRYRRDRLRLQQPADAVDR